MSRPPENVALHRAARAAGAAALVLGLAAAPPPVRADDAAAAAALPSASMGLRSFEACLAPLVLQDSAFRAPTDVAAAAERLSPAMRARWYGVHGLLSQALAQQFVGLSSDERRLVWWRRYWALRDPTPTTPENERLEEHERRVAHARQHFAALEAPYWDDRGAFYIRFGAPDRVTAEPGDVRVGLGAVPTRQVWSYAAHDLVAEFELLPGGWRLGRSGAKQSSRPDLAEDARGGSTDPERPAAAELAPRADRADLQAWAPAAAAIAASAVSESAADGFALPGPPRRFLPYVFRTGVFRGAAGRSRLEVHLQLDLRDLNFQWEDSLYLARYEVEGVLRDDTQEIVARDAYWDVVRAQAFQSTVEPRLWPGQLQFEVEPGLYRLAVRVVDQRTRDEGTYVADVPVRRLEDGRLVLSDLLMASWIDSAAVLPRSRFVKGDRLVVPNASAVYPGGRRLEAYFEIYGLQVDAEGQSHYRVEYSISPRHGAARVTSGFRADGRGPDCGESLEVDVRALDPEDYDLVLTVHDLVAGSVSAVGSRFRLQR